MEIRKLSSQEIEEKVNPELARRGFALLNLNEAQPTCLVLGAWEGERLLEVFAFQLYPVLGPLLRLEGADDGRTSRLLAESMKAFLEGCGARGYLLFADSPASARLAKRYGMTRFDVPVFQFVAPPPAPPAAQTSGGV